MDPDRRLRRDEQLALLSRLEWTVLRPVVERVHVRRWFACISAERPELAILISQDSSPRPS